MTPLDSFTVFTYAVLLIALSCVLSTLLSLLVEAIGRMSSRIGQPTRRDTRTILRAEYCPKTNSISVQRKHSTTVLCGEKIQQFPQNGTP